MTSILTGEMWVKEMLIGNPIRCVNAFRMEPQLFLKLCNDLSSKYGLKSSRNMSIHEKVDNFYMQLLKVPQIEFLVSVFNVLVKL